MVGDLGVEMEEQEEVKFERRDGSPGKCLQTHCGTECPLKNRNVKTLPHISQPAPNANKYKPLHQNRKLWTVHSMPKL